MMFKLLKKSFLFLFLYIFGQILTRSYRIRPGSYCISTGSEIRGSGRIVPDLLPDLGSGRIGQIYRIFAGYWIRPELRDTLSRDV